MGLYIILMGVQGAGKGMQASYISEEYGIPHISTGDMFRAMKQREDDLAQRVKKIMNAGDLVDDATTNEVVADRLSQDDARDGVILDGYPRNYVQADFLANYLAERDEAVSAVLMLELDLYVAFKRAFGRVTSEDTGESYNIYYKNDEIEWKKEEDPSGKFPPRIVATHTETGEALKRRSDDASAHAIITRIDTYLETTMPLLSYYRQRDLLHTVDAEQEIADVSADVKQIIESL